jgi:hypothetical protein
MLHKFFTIAMLGIISSTALIASGCASDNSGADKSYGLTGASASNDNASNPRYYDSKGHYRSDWVSQNGH